MGFLFLLFLRAWDLKVPLLSQLKNGLIMCLLLYGYYLHTDQVRTCNVYFRFWWLLIQFWVWTQLNPSGQTPEKTVRFVFQIFNSIIALRKSQYEWIKGKTTGREEMHSI
jgi:hypothetical protein